PTRHNAAPVRTCRLGGRILHFGVRDSSPRIPLADSDAGEPILKLRFLLRYALFWFLSFTVLRVVFLAYHAPEASQLPAATIAGLLLRGARMDASATAYLLVIPTIL